MTQQMAPRVPGFNLTLNGHTENLIPVPVSELAAELTICYKLGREGTEITRFYTLGLARMIKQRNHDPKFEQMDEIQQTYLDQVVAGLLTDLVINDSDLWPVYVNFGFDPDYSHVQWDNHNPAWLDMMMGLRRKEQVYLEVKGVPKAPH